MRSATNETGSGSDLVYAVGWSPDGQYVAVGGNFLNEDLYIYSALQFPSQNTIAGNTVYCNGYSSSVPFAGLLGEGI